jgi:rhodanese-related sulfurtransferase
MSVRNDFAADPQTALDHFEKLLSLETDCWDVHAALASGTPGFVLLDVRSPQGFEGGHVPGSLNLPHGRINERNLAAYPLDTLFVVYCNGPHCNGADRAAARLARLGRKVKKMIGGAKGWKVEGFAFEKGAEVMTQAQLGLDVLAPSAHRDKLLNLSAGRDPIEVLGQTASALADIVATHPSEILRGRAIQGKWTPNEIIGHLADSEWVYGYRLRLILCEDEPAILGFKQDAWVAAQRHNERDPSELVEIFRTLRALNLSVWRGMSPENLQRSGQHNERGPESLAVMLRLLAGHDLSHLDQIVRYIQALA